MKFEMTKCNQCGSEMLMGVGVCPSCGKEQNRRTGSLQPRTLLAVGLAAAVLLAFNWFKSAPPQTSGITPASSAGLPAR
jgi:transposase-like protein